MSVYITEIVLLTLQVEIVVSFRVNITEIVLLTLRVEIVISRCSIPDVEELLPVTIHCNSQLSPTREHNLPRKGLIKTTNG